MSYPPVTDVAISKRISNMNNTRQTIVGGASMQLLLVGDDKADLVIITDRTGVIEYINPAFEALTGYSPQEVIGQTPRILKSGQQTCEHYEEQWRTILSGNVCRGTMINREANGHAFGAERSVTPPRDNDGKVTHSS